MYYWYMYENIQNLMLWFQDWYDWYDWYDWSKTQLCCYNFSIFKEVGNIWKDEVLFIEWIKNCLKLCLTFNSKY
jgi:hypothetical protein